jgi:hypothetical protein
VAMAMGWPPILDVLQEKLRMRVIEKQQDCWDWNFVDGADRLD